LIIIIIIYWPEKQYRLQYNKVEDWTRNKRHCEESSVDIGWCCLAARQARITIRSYQSQLGFSMFYIFVDSTDNETFSEITQRSPKCWSCANMYFSLKRSSTFWTNWTKIQPAYDHSTVSEEDHKSYRKRVIVKILLVCVTVYGPSQTLAESNVAELERIAYDIVVSRL